MSEETKAMRAARARRAAGVAHDFDGRRLTLARRLSALSRAALARDIGLSPTAITQFEKNQTNPSRPTLESIAGRLLVPVEFFRLGGEQVDLTVDAAHFRSLRSTPAIKREQALAFAELALEALALCERYVDLPEISIPQIPVAPEAGRLPAIEAARETRAALGIKAGPIEHLTQLLEQFGVLVLTLPHELVDDRVDAFSTNEGIRPVVLLSPRKHDRARTRFDGAHELGHLVMHAHVGPGDKAAEEQAQAFAAEFLAPSDEIHTSLPNSLKWEVFLEAKRHWKISLQALVFRARDLGILTDASYSRGMQQLRIWGYPERGSLGPPEAPSLLGQTIALLEENGIGVSELASVGQISEHHLRLVIEAGSDQRLKISRK